MNAPKDNPIHRALFALPPVKEPAGAALAVPALPEQKRITGDAEIDAVLWLHDVIGTGHPELIAKAKEAAGRLVSPLQDIKARFDDWLSRTRPSDLKGWLSVMNFGDLDMAALNASARFKRQAEARGRFGTSIDDATPAEEFCNRVMEPMVVTDYHYAAEDADMMFDAHHDERPGSLMDCLLELTFWSDLYWLRDAAGGTGDLSQACNARDDYVFRMLSRIPPRNPEEAADVLRYLASNQDMDREHTGAILMNLVGAPEPYVADRGGR